MSISAINGGVSAATGEFPVFAPQTTSENNFSGALNEAINRLDAGQQEAHQMVAKAIEGDGTEVHEAVIAVQKAELSFQLAVQVRNKVVQAYQEVSRMQF